MDQNFEQNVPILPIIVGFIILGVFSTWLRKKLKKRALIREGQLATAGGRSASIEERIAGNSQWASGEIRSKGSSLMMVVWLLAVVWNLTFGVSFFKSLSNPEMKTGGIIVLGIFAVLGIVPVFFAIRLTLRQFRFGESSCSIKGKAGVLGREVSGFVRTKEEINPSGDYTIELKCIEIYTTGSGKNRRSETRVHWEGRQSVPYSGKSSKAGIPFSFELPPYPPETGYQLARGTVNWQIFIKAPVKGVDYAAMFVVPVFKMD